MESGGGEWGRRAPTESTIRYLIGARGKRRQPGCHYQCARRGTRNAHTVARVSIGRQRAVSAGFADQYTPCERERDDAGENAPPDDASSLQLLRRLALRVFT